jgi:Sap, sulfolipid-1-addressing protein
MPPQTLALALGASIYPPALAALIALARGSDFRPRMVAFVIAALSVTYALGVAMLLLLGELEIARHFERSPSAGIDIALGALLILIAVHLRRAPPKPKQQGSSSKVDRYLRSRRLAFTLGIVLYVVPSPIYIGAVKTISDADPSRSGQLLALGVTVVVMLWLIEAPMLLLLVWPQRATAVLEAVNGWFTRHGRVTLELVCLAAGLYLGVEGLIDVLG